MSGAGARERELATHLRTLDCVHCGLCIEHCPTYAVTGRESANPRGRVYLMRALLEGRTTATPDLRTDLDLCLVCRACESACPSGVAFGRVLTEVRSTLRKRGFFRRLMMDRVLPNPRRLHRLAGLLRFWQRSGLRFLRRLLPPRVRRMEAYLPPIPPRSERAPLERESAAVGTSLGRVGLLEGCIMSVLFQDVNRDTALLLRHAGFDVVVPEAQGCCGALHEHDGALDAARRLAARNVEAFTRAGIDRLVTNSSGCGAALLDAGHLLETDDARRLSGAVVDVTRILVEQGGRLGFRPLERRATYDAPCHLFHAMGETTAPLELLGQVPGLELVPLADAELCCGAAGVYNLDHPDTADEILERKLDDLEATGADLLLSGNPGCILQWRQGIARRGLEVEVLHPVSLLARQLAT